MQMENLPEMKQHRLKLVKTSTQNLITKTTKQANTLQAELVC